MFGINFTLLPLFFYFCFGLFLRKKILCCPGQSFLPNPTFFHNFVQGLNLEFKLLVLLLSILALGNIFPIQ